MESSESSKSLPWYLHPLFAHFWKHYTYSNQYLRNCGYNAVIHFDERVSLMSKQTKVQQMFATNEGDTVTSRMRQLEQFSDEEEEEMESECGHENEEERLRDDGEGDEEEISEGYLQFLLETRRHQEERERQREMRRKHPEVEYVDITEMERVRDQSVAPKWNDQDESVGGKKEHEASVLYGPDSNTILGMEAALSLNFNRLCDRNQPPLWPIIPIRIPR